MTRRGACFAVLAAAVLGAVSAGSPRASTIHRVPEDFRSVSQALESGRLQEGDILDLADGTYAEEVEVDIAGLTIRSRSGNPETCVFDHSETFGFSIAVPNCHIEGVTIRNSYGGVYSSLPVFLDNCVFENNREGGRVLGGGEIHGTRFIDNEFFGLGLRDAVLIEDCEFRGNRWGAVADFAEPGSQVIRRCTFVANKDDDASGGAAFRGGNVSFEDCTFRENLACTGGALYLNLAGAHSSLVNCRFEGNRAHQAGGAVYVGAGTLSLSRCTFTGNEQRDPEQGCLNTPVHIGGGAIFSRSWFDMENCQFSSNTATGCGGGVALELVQGNGEVTITGSRFLDNRSTGEHGGALSASNVFGEIRIRDSVIAGNLASGNGGGIHLSAAFGNQNVVLEGVTLASNTAGAGFGGGGFYAEMNVDVEIVRSIVAFSTSGSGLLLTGHSGTTTVSCTDVFGNAGGNWVGAELSGLLARDGNLEVDPGFCDCGTNDFTLAAGSPCLATGLSCGQLIGAGPEGCAAPGASCPVTPTRPYTWSRLKGRYRGQ